ncbi:MFS transporter [Tuberibacillus sp. Marseille-P3662]|uniref:MFS transporter n=1 Tax=Tuberibacillus sp. Marseille-P3662 TaxID=1965358 RepID=UPI000A1CD204|nr:MFS transporter [Tuberibacillus sp. Marseille-P3662]
MENKKTLDLLSLASIPLMMTLGNSMLIPVLPTIEQELKISAFQSSLIITVYSVVAIIFIPIAGYLSDRWGRKKIILPSLIIAAIGGAIAGLASWLMDGAYLLILAGRLLQGVGASGAFPVVIPTVGDLFKDEQEVSRGLGVIETSNTFGKVLSPIIGAFLAGFIWYLPFLSIPVLCLISILLVGFFVKSPKKQNKPDPFPKFVKNVKDIFKEKGKWLAAVFFTGGIIMFILFGTLFYLSELLESDYNTKGIKKGLYIAIPLFALSVSSLVTGKKIGQNKVLMKWLVFIGMLLLAVTMVLLSFKPTLLWFLSYLFIGGIGIGFVLPSLDAFITEGIEKENRGTITSLYSSMRFIGVAAGPPLFAMLMDASVKIMFLTAAGLTILAVIFTYFAIRPGNTSDQKQNQLKTT